MSSLMAAMAAIVSRQGSSTVEPPVAADVTFLQGTPDDGNSATYLFPAQNFGPASPDRYIVAVFGARFTGIDPVSAVSVSIGGVPATINEDESLVAANGVGVCVATAAVPNGTTGDVQIVWSRAGARCGLGLYAATEIESAVAFDTGFVVSSSAVPRSFAIDVEDGGIIIAGCFHNSPLNDVVWTGLSEDYDVVSEAAARFSTAHAAFTTGATVTVGDTVGGLGAVYVGVSWSPTNVVHVAPTGVDAPTGGTEAAPWRTLQYAVTTAPVGSTIDVRGGSYREAVEILTDKRLTIRAAVGEVVKLTASDIETGWAAGAGVWTKTIVGGGVDYTADFTTNQTIDPAFPLAGNLAMVIIDGVQQTMIAHPAVPTAGQFKVVGNLYTIGTNPSGKTVEVAKAAREVLLLVSGARNTTLRRLVFEHAPTATNGVDGALRVTPDSPNVTLDGCKFHQNQNCGVQIRSAGAVIEGNEFTQNGRIGLSMNETDSARVRGNNLFSENNWRRFDTGGAAGGFKITEARDLLVYGNRFLNNRGHGFWLDRSCLRVNVVANKAEFNEGMAYKIEVSAQVNVVSNSSRGDLVGVGIGESNNVEIWNNAICEPVTSHITALDGPRFSTEFVSVGDGYGFPFDSRFEGVYTPLSAWQPEITWEIEGLVVKNNMMAGGPDDSAAAPFQMLKVTDSSQERVVATGATTIGSPTLTATGADFTSADLARFIEGPNIPAGTRILSVTSTTSVQMTANATATGSSLSIIINPKFVADDMADADNNIYLRLAAGDPTQLVGWSKATGAYERYQTLAAFRVAHPSNEANGLEANITGLVHTVVSYPTNLMPAGVAAAAGAAIPAHIAALVGWSGVLPTPVGLLVPLPV